ncbi:MAG: bifunctional phosphoglucose/phosphomannose isomerase [Methanobacteriota archaeon]|nr:MAG: bifunctional phosphoglucose/phosphomannose isomerase [Euryarchaeota archaeon]
MLDNPEKIHSVDKSNMLGVISSLPTQIERSKVLVTGMNVPHFNPSTVIISGMGGSSVGGELVRDWLSNQVNIPIMVNRNSGLPRYADRNTLAIMVSYSGNTNETLSCARHAWRKGCQIVGIASGGKLEKFCKSNDFPHVLLPPGMPPRGAIGYLFSSVAYVLQEMALIRVEEDIHEARSVLEESQKHWTVNVDTDENPAKKTAKKMEKRTPIIYGHTFYNAVARRWQTQINENAKTMAWSSELPEMDHNEVEGWAGDSKGKKFISVFLRDKHENSETRSQVEATMEILGKRSKTHEVWSEGKTILSRMLHNLYLGDYVSFYLAVLKGVDPTPVRAIMEVKKKVYSTEY